MSENGRKLAEQMHCEPGEPHGEQNGPNPVEASRETLERQREEEQRKKALVEAINREAVEQGRVQVLPRREPKGVHYTELLPANPGEPLAEEWNTYRREVGRLLAEGLQGRYLLIKGEEIIGVYDTPEEATTAGLKRYLLQPFFVHPIRAEEPYLRIRGINFPWPISRLR